VSEDSNPWCRVSGSREGLLPYVLSEQEEELGQTFAEKKKRLRMKGVQRGVGRNLINLFIKRFSCLCWGCRVPTGNTRRLNEYRRGRRRRLGWSEIPPREEVVVRWEEVRAGSGTDTLFLMESAWSTGGQRSRIQRSSDTPCSARAR